MVIDQIRSFFLQKPLEFYVVAAVFLVALLLFFRNIIAKGLMRFASRTKTKVDDILIQHIKPMRIAWLAPIITVYLGANIIPEYAQYIEKGALFTILWISALSIQGLLNALNDIYESQPNFKGVSIQGYLDIAKILILAVAIILSISLFSGEPPGVLLTGLGALTAVLLLIFQNTILSLVASVQINSMDLIKEGDWIEVPSYGADGDVLNISLHTIKVRNFDMTTTIIPTHKVMDVAYKNWRGMRESGGRRIKRRISVDMTSMKFCDAKLLKEIGKIDLICDYVEAKIQELEAYKVDSEQKYDSPLDGPQVTNTEFFREYIAAYLKSRKDIHHKKMPFLIRSLEPTITGLPIEIYIFTKTTVWEEFEDIQSEIFDHILSAAQHFDLRVFQEPTGQDFRQLLK